MKKSIILLLSGVIFFGSCDNAPKSSEGTQANLIQQKQDADNLTASLKELDVPSQVFSAPGGEVSLIRGKKGTVIFLSPSDLETENGQAPGKHVIVELKELTTQAELARANAQTVSNGGLLVSGGAYYINMTSDGKKLKLKKDRTLKVAFPKITDSAMMLYYGDRDSSGQMNWRPTDMLLSAKEGYGMDTGSKSIMVYDPRTFKLMGYVGNDSTYKRDTAALSSLRRDAIEQQLKAEAKKEKIARAARKLNSNLYDISNLRQLGWINCDRLYPGASRTNITYTIDPKDSILVANIYLIYPEFNSVVSETFYNDKTDGTRHFPDIPTGYKARLLAVTSKNNDLFACKMDLTIVNDQHTLFIWKKTTKAELNNYFDPNYNWGQ